MNLTTRTFWAPKAGNSEDEFEDAYWPRRLYMTISELPFNFAVADGATESAFAALWARRLVKLYCHSQLWSTESSFDSHLFRDQIQHNATEWSAHVFSKPLPWFAIEKAQLGAFSTLLGLTIETRDSSPPQTGQWHALAVGDSCLFHIRDDRLHMSWPISHSSELGYRPNLLSTVPESNELLWPQIENCVIHEEWRAGDYFLLMTDALAHWFLQAQEAGELPWAELQIHCDFNAQFRHWLDALRSAGTIRNDDVTLVIIHIDYNS